MAISTKSIEEECRKGLVYYGKMLRLKSRFSSLVGRLSPKTIEEDCRTGLFILRENATAEK